ncbi:MAG: isoprenylcysteine carboxylmethyltransferase family protein [Saprospiraceae bacterium]|nr:isoprenylcysteine carboxylmethyltransferase family protein [Saprospiraceae bacterium]
MSALIIFWLAFGISHSFLAATSVRIFFEKLAPNNPHYFRLIYNGISLVLVYLIVKKIIEWAELMPILKDYFLIKLIGGALILSGFYVLLGVAKQMNLSVFFGFAKEENKEGLMTDGWYKIVRHPLYFGLILLFLGVFCLFPTWGIFTSLVFSTLYILIGVEFEEKKLRRVFGQSYIDFSKGKKKFIPFVY